MLPSGFLLECVLPQWGGFRLHRVFRTSSGVTFFEGVEFAACTDEEGVPLYWWCAACPESSNELRNRRSMSKLLVIEASLVTCFLVAKVSFQPMLIGKEAIGIRGMLSGGSIFTVGVEGIGLPKPLPRWCSLTMRPAESTLRFQTATSSLSARFAAGILSPAQWQGSRSAVWHFRPALHPGHVFLLVGCCIVGSSRASSLKMPAFLECVMKHF